MIFNNTCYSNICTIQKGDEVYVVDCTKTDRWYGISANNHGYFLPQCVTKEDKVINFICI